MSFLCRLTIPVLAKRDAESDNGWYKTDFVPMWDISSTVAHFSGESAVSVILKDCGAEADFLIELSVLAKSGIFLP